MKVTNSQQNSQKPNKPVFKCFRVETPSFDTITVMKVCKDSQGRSWQSIHGIHKSMIVDVDENLSIADTTKAAYWISKSTPPEFYNSEETAEAGPRRYFSALKNYSRVDDLVTGTDPVTGELIKFSVDFENENWFDGQFMSGIRKGEFAKLLK